MKLSLQKKFLLIGLITSLIVLSMVVESIVVSNQKVDQIKNMRLIAIVTQRHMEGDMMHDAIRSDAMSGVLSILKSDEGSLNKAKSDLQEHYNIFKENIVMNKNEPLPENIKALFDGLLVSLESYKEATKQLLNGGEENVDLLKEAFETKFEAMEVQNSSISEEINKWAQSEEGTFLKVAKVSKNVQLTLSFLAILLSLFVPFYAWKSVFTPLSKIISSMKQLAEGNSSVEIINSKRKDEIGQMASALAVFKEDAIEKENLEKEQKIAEQKAEEEKKVVMENLANRFEERVQGMIQSVAASATELMQTAESMVGDVNDVDKKSITVSESSNRTSSNVATVASASEQMSASVKEISSQITRSTSVVNDAVKKTEDAESSGNSLESASKQIGSVVNLIHDIAEQINLLALNATIESARAGEAGKGFAVVASEVKNLSNQATKATDEISSQIDNVQSISAEVFDALNAIKAAVDKVNEYSGGISAAVEEQTATTSEIVENMMVASKGTKEVNDNISDITKIASHAKDSSMQMMDASRLLSQESEQLSQAVSVFLQEVRNG